MEKYPTYFVDIDGTLMKYRAFSDIGVTKPEAIKSVVNMVNEAFINGAHIVITSARPETLRGDTIVELYRIGVKYNQLLLGIGRGTRYVINDKDPKEPNVDRAIGINLTRNQGL